MNSNNFTTWANSRAEPTLVREGGEDCDQDEQFTSEILGPSASLSSAGVGGKDSKGRRVGRHSLSAIVRLSIDGNPVALFPGDLDNVGLDDLIQSGMDAKAPVLIFPHHGGGTSSTDKAVFVKSLCELVKPATVVFSIGRGRHGTPRPAIVELVRQTVPGVRVVCTQLSEHCAATIPKHESDHLTRLFAIGRQFRHCCAGTILVSFDKSTASLLPVLQDHMQFIAGAASEALCRRH